MSVPCSDCFSDLVCDEDSAILSGEFPECSSDVESQSCLEGPIASFIEDERNFIPGCDYLARFRSDNIAASARAESVAWILKVHAFYGFQPLTACLSVNYFDRFLYSRLLPQSNGWPLQLLSVACLSIAAKMEEPLVPSLLEFQVEGAKYIFEPRTVCRMELLVLNVLDWRLRSITPFSFIGFFACKLDSTGTLVGFLKSRATEIILSYIQEASFLEYWPSCIAVAALLSAANDIPNLSMVNPEHAESWCDGLSKEKIMGCFRLMQEFKLGNSQKKITKILSQIGVTTRTRMRSIESFSSSLSSTYKKRRLDKCLWGNDDQGNSE